MFAASRFRHPSALPILDAAALELGTGTAALYFVLSVLPTGGFFAERKLRREAEHAVNAAIASRVRQEEAYKS